MSKPKPLPESLITGPRKKIIYVDDMNFNQLSLKKGIGKYYEIYPASSSLKMYEILEKVTPDVILLDVNLPEVNGYDIIKNLKTDERYSGIMVIFLTYNSDRASVVKGLGLGAADYVIKPIDASKIIESIESQFFTRKNKEAGEDDDDKGNPKILVVDDISSMLRTAHNALHDKYKVYLLSRPEEVVDFLLNNKVDLILLD
jgi:PleD family two-component response regulator